MNRLNKINISINECMDAFSEYCMSHNDDCSTCKCKNLQSKPACFIYFVKEIYNIDLFDKFGYKRTVK